MSQKELTLGGTTGVVGAQWGDEGKGKFVDLFAREGLVVVVRSGGCDNAGHTIVNETIANEGHKLILHAVPSGVCNPDALLVIGPGMLVNQSTLIREINNIEALGIRVRDRLAISGRSTLLIPDLYPAIDAWQEEQRGISKVGTTGKGIGPAYADRFGRFALQADTLTDPDVYMQELSGLLEQKRNTMKVPAKYKELFDPDHYREMIIETSEFLSPFIQDTTYLINKKRKEGYKIIIEGAQGTMLDPIHGTYRNVTSCPYNTVAGAYAGAGIPFADGDEKYGVYKAYSTRVGGGTQVAELVGENEDLGQLIRKKGDEFGSTTGRARRVGWFDAVAGYYSLLINGFNRVAISKLDVLADLPYVGICVAYELNGKTIGEFPQSERVLKNCKPVVEYMDSWSDIKNAQEWDQLPLNAQKYIQRLSQFLPETQIWVIGTGPDRDAIIFPPKNLN